MIPISIHDLLGGRLVESTRIEYKEGFNPDAIIRTLCAFANDIDNIGGGYVVIGVKEENGMPVFPLTGVVKESIDGILKKLRQYCHFIEPLYEPIVETVEYDGVSLIVIWAPGGYGRPYRAPKYVTKEQYAKYFYIRKFSSTVIASPDEEKELFYISSDIPFDDRPNLLADVNDLDLGLIRQHLKQTNSALYELSKNMDLKDVAANMHLLGGPSEYLHPLNVAVLMFSEHPEKYFPYARIEIVDIPNPDGTNISEKVFTGPIQRQLQDALAYLRNYLITSETIKTKNEAEAMRIYNYPFGAIEEILANAVYHRSYQIAEPTTIRIERNRVEITSFPGFDRSITDRNIETGDIRSRCYRNRRIGDFLKELRLTEGRNTGFPTAKSAMLENGSPELMFEMNPERDYLSVILPIHPHFRHGDDKTSEFENRILSTIETSPMSLTNLSYALGYKGISEKLRRTVNGLLRKGELIIGIDGSGKPCLFRKL